MHLSSFKSEIIEANNLGPQLFARTFSACAGLNGRRIYFGLNLANQIMGLLISGLSAKHIADNDGECWNA